MAPPTPYTRHTGKRNRRTKAPAASTAWWRDTTSKTQQRRGVASGVPWWRDKSSHAQQIRGILSGIRRRVRSHPRDEHVATLRAMGLRQSEIARHVRLSQASGLPASCLAKENMQEPLLKGN